MCGIAGIVGPGAARHRHLVPRMLAIMRHRGPDSSGVWANADAVLGCARLAVIDPAHGDQPIVSPGPVGSGSVVVVGNGEIYGHRRLRALEDPGAFTSDSDMEIVAPLWRRHGVSLPEHLPGSFSVALFDESSSTLLLARDAFGERPLYWSTFDGGLLAFASDPAALLGVGIVDRQVDRAVLSQMVRIGYVPPGECIWNGMQSLRPGHRLVLGPDSQDPSVERWWSPPRHRVDRSAEDAAAWLRDALTWAVDEQLEADVGVGVFLSGGLDSSTVAALVGRRRPGALAFAFDMPVDSELAWAERVAERHGLALRTCAPDESCIAEDLLAASSAWSEPFGDSSALVTWQLARRAADEVKVVLTGDGADELLGGYASWSREALAATDLATPAQRFWRRRPAAPRGSAIASAYRGVRSYFEPGELVALGLVGSGPDDVDVSAYRWGDVEDICRFDVDWYLPGDILVKTDRASMDRSLEVRAPFLDRAVAEGCLMMPAHLKIDDHHEKLVLRRAFSDLWPDGLARRAKQGFGAPMDRWLAEPGVTALVHDLFDHPGSPVYDLVERDAALRHLAIGGQQAWTLLMVGLWWRHHGPAVAV